MVGACVGLHVGEYVGNLVGLNVVGFSVGESQPNTVGVVDGIEVVGS